MRKLQMISRPRNLLHSIVLLLLTKIILLHDKSYAFINKSILPKSKIPSSVNTNLLKPTTISISLLKQNTKLNGKLWDRLEIEEREEMGWYLLNCVVGNELALKAQVEVVLSDFPKYEVEQISVPSLKSLRSHGKRHVVDDVVLYPGYVFVKMQLTCDVYEAIQSCTLCRSFMGTIRMKGMYTSLPSIPTMLSPEEVAEFKGLEDKIQKENEEEKSSTEQMLEPYKGYEVGQMCKVINGKFKGEDGMIKRLKNLKIGVRLFTYGSNYDQWFEPDDIRLLNEVESMRGLAGPDKPIYNRQFQEIVNPDKYKKKERDNARFTRDSSGRNFRSVFGGGGGRRNRKQDRVFRGDSFYSKEEDTERQERQNWENYKRKQDQERKRELDDIDRAMAHEDGQDYNADWIGSPNRPTSKRASRSDDDNSGLDFLNDILDSLPQKQEEESKREKKEKTKDDFLNTLLEDFDNSFGDSKNNNNQYSNTNNNNNAEEDDFFATLEQEMLSSTSYNNNPSSSSSEPKQQKQPQNELYKDDDENFTFQEYENKFLENKKNSELNVIEYDGSTQKEITENIFKDDDDLLKDAGTGDDDFFNSLDLDDLYSSEEKVHTTTTTTKSKSSSEKKQHHASSSKSNSDYNEATLQKYTVPQLKEELRNKNLKVSGKKSELIQRLLSS